MLRRAALNALIRLDGTAAASQGLKGVLLQQAATAAQAELQAPLLRLLSKAPAAQLLQQQQQQRHYAQPAGPKGAYTMPSVMQRPVSIRATMVSSNLLAEPYKGEPPKLPLSAWFTLGGWKERLRRLHGSIKSVFTIAKCKRNIPQWTLPAFKEEVLDLYQKINKQLAEGDRTELRHLVTPTVFSDMKRQLKQREDGGWARVEWGMSHVPTIKECQVVQGRVIALDPKDDSTGFVQLTVKFPSKQRFAAYDRRGRLVAGDLEKEVAVVDHWVFEHPLRKQTSNRWRLAARLAVPQPKSLAA
ncbi:hypothetical protein N2152v2_003823 [Parachlorella kessleri]